MNSEFADAMRERVDTMLIGRDTYLGFEQHFGASAVDPAAPAGLVDVPAEVAALKTQQGRDMVAFGGVSLVNSLVEHGLVDEYWIKLAPTAIGAGRPLFRTRTPLRLLDSEAWPSGTLTLRYAAA